MISALDAKNVIGSRGFCTNTAVKGAAMKLKDSECRPTASSVFQGETVAFSTSCRTRWIRARPRACVPRSSMGDGPTCCWHVGALELLTNRHESAYRRGNVAVRGI